MRRLWVICWATLTYSAASISLHAAEELTAAATIRKGSGSGAVHVAYSTDGPLSPGLLTSMLSLSKSLANPQHCTIHLFLPTALVDKGKELAQCLEDELAGKQDVPSVKLHEMRDDDVHFDPDRIRAYSDLKGHRSVYFRVYLPELLPDVDRVLYLDTDTVVRSDVASLFQMPMNYSVAGCHENAKLGTFLLSYLSQKEQLEKLFPNMKLPMLQTGVMLLDLNRWRAENITSSLEGWAKELKYYSLQLLYNIEFQKRGFDVLPETWDMYGMGLSINDPARVITRTPKWTPVQLQQAHVLHFSGFQKPWFETSYSLKGEKNYAYKDLYDQYAPSRHCAALPGEAR